MAIACAVLSVLVVTRRWAFIGEGISHAGLGGAGTAWILMLLFPALDLPWVPYASVVIFCLATAMAIGWAMRGDRLNSDTAIGIFLVASLAWGFLAQNLYLRRHTSSPPGWNTFFFGETAALEARFALISVCLCVAVIFIVALLRKEILYYALDPTMAEVSGVRARFVHYLLMLLVAIVIVLGVQIVGTVLMTALLVLPGATAMVMSERLSRVVFASIAVSLIGTLGGLLIHAQWMFIPTGPAIVLVLFGMFVVVFAGARLLHLPFSPTAAGKA